MNLPLTPSLSRSEGTAMELSPAAGPDWQALNLNLNRNLARLRFLEIKSKITIKIGKKPFRLNSMAVPSEGGEGARRAGEGWFMVPMRARKAPEILFLDGDESGNSDNYENPIHLQTRIPQNQRHGRSRGHDAGQSFRHRRIRREQNSVRPSALFGSQRVRQGPG